MAFASNMEQFMPAWSWLINWVSNCFWRSLSHLWIDELFIITVSVLCQTCFSNSAFRSGFATLRLHFMRNWIQISSIITLFQRTFSLFLYLMSYGTNIGDLGAVLKSIFRPKPLKGMLNSIVFEKLKWYIIFIPLLKFFVRHM